MLNRITREYSASLLAGLTLTVAFSILVSIASADAPSGKAIKAEQIQFEQIAPFVQMGGAWGDRAQGAHGTFVVARGT